MQCSRQVRCCPARELQAMIDAPGEREAVREWCLGPSPAHAPACKRGRRAPPLRRRRTCAPWRPGQGRAWRPRHTRTCTWTRTSKHAHRHARTHARTHTHTHIHTYIQTDTRTHTVSHPPTENTTSEPCIHWLDPLLSAAQWQNYHSEAVTPMYLAQRSNATSST